MQRDLGLVYRPEHWDAVRLATWLCQNLPGQTLDHASKRAFVAGWLNALLRRDGFTLARANLQKFQLRKALGVDRGNAAPGAARPRELTQLGRLARFAHAAIRGRW